MRELLAALEDVGYDPPLEGIRRSIEAAYSEGATNDLRYEESSRIRQAVENWLQAVIGNGKGSGSTRRIFLSHKSANKDLVRRFRNALSCVGLEPWLDEDHMCAGEVPARAIQKALESSCAVVFFITPDFRDEKWLSEEIDLALDRKRVDPKDFSVITLVLRQGENGAPVVPTPLKRFVYKEIASDLEGFAHIIRALPMNVFPRNP